MATNPLCRTQDWIMDPLHYFFSLPPDGERTKAALEILKIEIKYQKQWLAQEIAMLEEIEGKLPSL